MPATITITRPTFVDTDQLNASQSNAVWITSASVPDAESAVLGVIQLAGDLAGTAAAPVIGANKVTFAKFQQIATLKVLGRATAGTGDVEALDFTAAGQAMAAAADEAAQLRLLVADEVADVLESADLAAMQAALSIGASVNRVVTSQFDKTDTTLADVPGLSVAVEAGGTYSFEVSLHVTQNTTGRGKIAIGGTCTVSAFISNALYTDTNTAAISLGGLLPSAKGAGFIAGNTNSTGNTAILHGTVTVSASGTLTVQFAQNAASGTSSVLVGSFLRVWKY